MTIAEKTRKQLWAKSGNRCAICKEELFQKPDVENGKLNVGEECHIISKKKNGPRHIHGLRDYDTSDNLLLLCRNHHKEIDTLTESYPEELLRFMKTNHESWVSDSLRSEKEKSEKGNARLIKRISSGKELFETINNVHGCKVDYDEQESAEENEYIGSILQSLADYVDLLGMVAIEPAQRIQISNDLNNLLIEMEERGYFLFADKTKENTEYSIDPKDQWDVATILIKQKDSNEIARC